MLITGGAGFIGSRLAKKLLQQGEEVRILDILSPQIHGGNPTFPQHLQKDCECILGDVRDSDLVKKALSGVDEVVHLAAETGMGQSQYEIQRYSDVNVNGTAVLLQSIVDTKRSVHRIVLSSTGRIYGEGPYVCLEHGRFIPETRGKEKLLSKQWVVVCRTCGGPVEPAACLEEDMVSPGSMYAVTKLTQESMLGLFGKLYGVETVILRYQNVYGEGQSLEKSIYRGDECFLYQVPEWKPCRNI